MSDQRIAILCEDEQRAWGIAEQLNGEDTTASVCDTSDELHQLVTTSQVDALVVDQALPGFLSGLDILTRLASAPGGPATLLLGDLRPEATDQARALGTRILPAQTTPEQVAEAVRAAARRSTRGRHFPV